MVAPVQVPAEYRFDAVETEIRRAVAEVQKKHRGLAAMKVMAAETGIGYKDLGRRLNRSIEIDARGNETRRRFLDVEELGRVAAWIGEKLGEPMPPGWPLQTVAAYRRHLKTVSDTLDSARPR